MSSPALWRGERPSIDDYTEKYPQWADEIRDVFPAVQMMEELEAAARGQLAHRQGRVWHTDIAERIGEFRIVREIGRGGMGVVYEAFQESLGRRVALRGPARSSPGKRNLRARFHRESHAAAKLHHTNIVPVFGVGEQGGLCFYVMQLMAGTSLDQEIGRSETDHERQESGDRNQGGMRSNT